MIDRGLLEMPASELIALYESCRRDRGSPHRAAMRRAIEHRAEAAETGSLDCLDTGISYKWDPGVGSVVRLEMPPTLTSYRRQRSGRLQPAMR